MRNILCRDEQRDSPWTNCIKFNLWTPDNRFNRMALCLLSDAMQEQNRSWPRSIRAAAAGHFDLYTSHTNTGGSSQINLLETRHLKQKGVLLFFQPGRNCVSSGHSSTMWINSLLYIDCYNYRWPYFTRSVELIWIIPSKTSDITTNLLLSRGNPEHYESSPTYRAVSHNVWVGVL